MAMALSVDQRLDLITQGIPSEDIQGIDAIRSALENPEKRPRCLWGKSWASRLNGIGNSCLHRSYITYRQT